MKRTGSSGSRVPPAVTTSLRPASAPSEPSTRRICPINVGVSGSLPAPSKPLASRPLSGSITCAPRCRRVVRLACVAGCSLMPPSIAGAMSRGQREARAVTESMSSARPCASFAIVLAVAGATASRSASSAKPTCAICVGNAPPDSERHRFVYTGRPLTAANVSELTKRCAASVSTTSTRAPACVSLLARFTALYAAMLPQTPRMIRLSRSSAIAVIGILRSLCISMVHNPRWKQKAARIHSARDGADLIQYCAKVRREKAADGCEMMI